MDACESLLNRNKIDQFLKRMVTGDEKWVTYDNVKRKRSWSKSGEGAQTVAKPGLTARKILLCVWCTAKNCIFKILIYASHFLETPKTHKNLLKKCLHKKIILGITNRVAFLLAFIDHRNGFSLKIIFFYHNVTSFHRRF